MDVEIIPAPGGYGDGPAFVRVHRERAGAAWPAPGYPRTTAEPMDRDRDHDYVWAENTHNAFVVRASLRAGGLPPDALTVVRVRAVLSSRTRMGIGR